MQAAASRAPAPRPPPPWTLPQPAPPPDKYPPAPPPPTAVLGASLDRKPGEVLGVAGESMLLLRSTGRGSAPIFSFNPDPLAGEGHAATRVVVGAKTACVLLPFVSTAAERTGERLNCVLEPLDELDAFAVTEFDNPDAVLELPVGVPTHRTLLARSQRLLPHLLPPTTAL